MDITKMTVEQRVMTLLEDHEPKMSQEDLGKAVGLTQGQISRIKRGERKINANEVISFANALHEDPVYILTGFHQTNYALSKELGLSDETITDLLDIQMDSEANLLTPGINMAALVIDTLVANKDLLTKLFGYFFRSLKTFVIDNRDGKFGHENPDFVSTEADRVYNYPLLDFERLERMYLMDELKKVRDNLSERREEMSIKIRTIAQNKAENESGQKILAQKLIQFMNHIDEIRGGDD